MIIILYDYTCRIVASANEEGREWKSAKGHLCGCVCERGEGEGDTPGAVY